MAKVYYLNWDQEHRSRETPELDPASELFHKLSVKDVLDEEEKPGTEYSIDEFDELYREVADVDVDVPGLTAFEKFVVFTYASGIAQFECVGRERVPGKETDERGLAMVF